MTQAPQVRRPRRARTLSQEEIDDLGVSTTVPIAGRAYGLDKATAYRLAAEGKFPCAVIRVGSRYVVPVAELRRSLGLDVEALSA